MYYLKLQGWKSLLESLWSPGRQVCRFSFYFYEGKLVQISRKFGFYLIGFWFSVTHCIYVCSLTNSWFLNCGTPQSFLNDGIEVLKNLWCYSNFSLWTPQILSILSSSSVTTAIYTDNYTRICIRFNSRLSLNKQVYWTICMSLLIPPSPLFFFRQESWGAGPTLHVYINVYIYIYMEEDEGGGRLDQ